MGIWRALWGIANPINVPSCLVTLDALGTLYKFRQPVATQYLHVARECGLTAKLDLGELDRSFKQSFRHYSSEYPNYGKRNLENPAAWWNLVVRQAFGQVVQGGESSLPQDLGSAIYRHFSSGAAYELFPDVKPFLRSMAALKRLYRDPDGPIVLTGIVTNSDPRENLLQTLGLRVGPSQDIGVSDMVQSLRDMTKEPRSLTGLEVPYQDFYDINNDFDVMTTSYDAGVEKPDAGIWMHAVRTTGSIAQSRAHGTIEQTKDLLENHNKTMMTIRYHLDEAKMMRIHVGDEYSKDYVGATNAGWEALHLARQNDPPEGLGRDVKMIRSLDEVAMILNVMANDFFEQAKA